MAEYIPHTRKDISEMLGILGLEKPEDLFDIDRKLRAAPIDLAGHSEFEAGRIMSGIAAKNKFYSTILLGAGAYNHYIPSVVGHLASRSEFVTAYTPYQAEMSQGILQAIYEYQTYICRLTGMDASNASSYDGATAAADACLACGEGDILVSEGVNPAVVKVIETYLLPLNRRVVRIPLKQDGTTDVAFVIGYSRAAGVLIANPNYFGVIENAAEFGSAAKASGAKLIVYAYPVALALLPAPGEAGADFCVGEGQPMGLPLNNGGPYLGFIAARESLVRKLPGRIVGRTTDDKGRTAYVLTLQAREQHIRREKASSSICSNQAHCALTANIYLSVMGSEGFREVAGQCLSKAHYFADALIKAGMRLKYSAEFFNEFVTVSNKGSGAILRALANKGILGGLKLSDREMLWCVTETVSKEEVDKAAQIISAV